LFGVRSRPGRVCRGLFVLRPLSQCERSYSAYSQGETSAVPGLLRALRHSGHGSADFKRPSVVLVAPGGAQLRIAFPLRCACLRGAPSQAGSCGVDWDERTN